MKARALAVAALVVVGAGVVATRYTQLAPAVASQPKKIHVVWCPGGYSNFVVVRSESLAVPLVEWKSVFETADTNFYFEPSNQCGYFAVYGTNSDGDFSWGQAGTNCKCQ